MKKYKKQICLIAAVCLLGTAAFCGYHIYDHYADEAEQTEAFENIAEIVEQAQAEDGNAPEVPLTEEENILTEYGKLYLKNTDMVGWLSIAGTTLNYPVMQTPNEPNYYLKHNFEKEYSDLGTPYADKAAELQTAAGSSYKRGYLSDLRGHGAFYDRQSGGLDQYPVPFAGPDGNCSGYSGLVYKGFSVFMDFIRRYDPVDPLQCLGGFCKENHSAAENVSVPYAGLADRAGRDPGCAADAGADISTWDFILSQGSGNAALLIWMAANAVWGQRRKKVLEVE